MFKVFNKNQYPLMLGTGLDAVTVPAHGEITTSFKPKPQDGIYISDITPPTPKSKNKKVI